MKATLCLLFLFWAKISKSHNKIDRIFLQLQDATADGNTRKQNYQCMNNVLQNISDNWKLLL